MATVAAIWYTVDQSEASNPFLLELDCPADPTRSEVVQALGAKFEQLYRERMMLDRPVTPVVTRSRPHTAGDFRVHNGDSDDETFLIISLSEQLRRHYTG